MKRHKLVLPIIAIALVSALGVGALTYQAVKAAAPALKTSAGVFFHRGGNPVPGQLHLEKGETQEYLAEALGITTDELEAAYQEAQKAALKKAVEAGLITQDQADHLESVGNGFPSMHRSFGLFSEGEIDFNALLAEALGITVEKLEAAQIEAFQNMINQSVSDGDITQEQADLVTGRMFLHDNSAFQETMKSAYEGAVQQAVENGVITQAQADQLLLNSPAFGSGGMHGFGVMGEGFGHRPHGGEWGGHAEKWIEPESTP